MTTASTLTLTTTIAGDGVAEHPVVSSARWTEARLALLAREKELMRQKDQLARERRALPWEKVEKNYLFDTTAGPRSLAELFGPRRQLLVQHFMLGPGWAQGCPSCSYMADHTDGMNVHLAQRDVSFVAVSRAPLEEIERFKARMGWKFDWVSSHRNDFNFDFHVSFGNEERAAGPVFYNYHRTDFPAEEAPGISAFCKDGAGTVFHTYSTFGRGVEVMMGTYNLLDLMPKGRGEREDAPNKMEWVRHHDRYAPAPASATASCCASRGA